jgi:hypothetical protein
MAKQPRKPLMGRPPMPPEKRKRVSMGFRPTPELRKKLEDASAASGLSMTQEVEQRLGRSFEAEKRVDEIANIARQNCYDAFGGKGRYHIFELISDAVADSEEYTQEHWMVDPRTFKIAKAAVLSVMNGVGPKAPEVTEFAAFHYVGVDERSPSEIGQVIAERRLKVAIGTDWPEISAKNIE